MFFFFNDTATTEIYTLSLHDALPICGNLVGQHVDAQAADRVHHAVGGHADLHVARLAQPAGRQVRLPAIAEAVLEDRKSTRLNSSHVRISYAVFCLNKNTIPSDTVIT